MREQSAPLRRVRDQDPRSVLARAHYVDPSRCQARWQLELYEVWRQMSRLRSDRLHAGDGSGNPEPGQKALVSRGLRARGSRKALCFVDTSKGRPCCSLTTCGRGEPNLARPSGSWDLSKPTATCANPKCPPPGRARLSVPRTLQFQNQPPRCLQRSRRPRLHLAGQPRTSSPGATEPCAPRPRRIS